MVLVNDQRSEVVGDFFLPLTVCTGCYSICDTCTVNGDIFWTFSKFNSKNCLYNVVNVLILTLLYSYGETFCDLFLGRGVFWSEGGIFFCIIVFYMYMLFKGQTNTCVYLSFCDSVLVHKNCQVFCDCI